MRWLAVLWTLLSLAGLGCPAKDPLERLIRRLEDPASREGAVDGLLVLLREVPAPGREEVRKRVVYALTEAYRADHARGSIVSALALLRAPEGEEVFTAALQDFERGGEYFEAAIRSARLLGELAFKQRVPEMTRALKRAVASPRADRNTWLERTLIQSLDRLGDRRALPVLLEVLGKDPSIQDFYLNKLAARALGHLRDPAATPALVQSLGASHHGLLLLEESRRALCRIGAAASEDLLRVAAVVDRRGQPPANAEQVLLLLGDLGQTKSRARLEPLWAAERGDSYRLALAETRLRLGDNAASASLLAVLDSPGASITLRRRAAELLGWYGGSQDLGQDRLLAACKDSGDPARGVLCWSLLLAYTRLSAGDGDGETLLEQLARARTDPETQGYLSRYRVRLSVVSACSGEAECLVKYLSAPDWRVRERAALELGRAGEPARAPELARAMAGAHPQVQRAILVALERLLAAGAPAPEVLSALPVPADADRVQDNQQEQPEPALLSRLICLRERLSRDAGKLSNHGEAK